VRLQFADDFIFEGALSCLEATHADHRLRTIEVATEGSAAEVLEMLTRLGEAGAPAVKVSTHRPSLDDVFLSLTGAGGPIRNESKEMAR